MKQCGGKQKNKQRKTFTIKKTSPKGLVFSWGAVVEEVRTVFAQLNDATIYIPDLREKVAA